MTNKEFIEFLKVTGKLTSKTLNYYMIINHKVIELIENSEYDVKEDFKKLDSLGLPIEEILYYIGTVLIKRKLSNELKEMLYGHLSLISKTLIFEKHQWVPCIDAITDILDGFYFDDKETYLQVLKISDIGFDKLKIRLNGIIYEIVMEFNPKTYNKEYTLCLNGKVVQNNLKALQIISDKEFRIHTKPIEVCKCKNNLILV